MLIVSQDLIATFAERFINHADAYYQQWSSGEAYGYRAVYRALTVKILTSHFEGHITISAPALDENNKGRWICFDSDIENGALDKLDSFLHQWHWHTIREGRRANRDGHLWLLFDSPIAGKYLVVFASTMIKLAGLSDAGLESFPKQAHASKLASGIRLPLGVHRKPGAGNCRGLFGSCTPKDIGSQLTWLVNQPLNNASTAMELAELHAPIELPPIRKKITAFKGTLNFKAIAQAALLNARAIAETWLPGGKYTGSEYVALNPTRNDQHRHSFSINWITGKWADFAINDAKGADLISLVAYLEKCSQLEAAKRLASFIGCSDT